MRSFSPAHRTTDVEYQPAIDVLRFRDRNFLEPDLQCYAVGLTTALVMGGLAAAGSIGGAAINAHAAGKAADTQANAADQIRTDALAAADKATTTVNTATGQANDTLTAAKQEQLKALAPYIQAGTVSLADLQKLLSDDGPLSGTNNQFSFNAKDFGADDPGYQFIRDQANQQAQRTAAAQGVLLTGGTQKSLVKIASGLASTHLDSAFNRALETYTTNRQNVLSRIQGLQNITGLGYNALGQQDQDIGSTATQVSGNITRAGMYAGQTGLSAAEIAAEATAGKANAQAAGDVATGNAFANGLGGATNAVNSVISQYKMPQFVFPAYTRRAPGMGLDPGYDPITGAPTATGSSLNV